MKNFINIAWDVIETNWYEMKIKRKIIEIQSNNFFCQLFTSFST